MIINFTVIKSDPLNSIRKTAFKGNYLFICSLIGFFTNRLSDITCHLRFPARFSKSKLLTELKSGPLFLNESKLSFCANIARFLQIYSFNSIVQFRTQKPAYVRINISFIKWQIAGTEILQKDNATIYAYLSTIRKPIPQPRRYEIFFTNLLSMG
jgi:hypothetical protein